MFYYPNKLNILFDKLYLFGIKPIIVGGYIRDNILNTSSNDIDIELYGLDSLDILEGILQEFGEVNTVGKSFGVCKLKFGDIEIDFSLPREDSKVALGHKGFTILTNKNLDFKSATSRRDFTINAIGYDIRDRKLLDPFNGQKDIQKKILRAVDLDKFSDDPLRILRGIQLCSRLNFKLEKELLMLFKLLISQNILSELPKERIFEELKKMFLKSTIPSIGLRLLKKLSLLEYFNFSESYEQVDYFASNKTLQTNTDILIYFALVYSKEYISSLQQLTSKKKILSEVTILLEMSEIVELNDDSNYALYKLATKVNIKTFLLYIDAYHSGKEKDKVNKLREKAISLNILTKKLPALLQGKDLIDIGLSPAKEFSRILLVGYETQMREEFFTLDGARKWLKIYTSTLL